MDKNRHGETCKCSETIDETPSPNDDDDRTVRNDKTNGEARHVSSQRADQGNNHLVSKLSETPLNPTHNYEYESSRDGQDRIDHTLNRKYHLKSPHRTSPKNVTVPNFRELSVHPTTSDIHAEMDPYLRPIKAKGEYANLDQYLDTHFRLLREDFMIPLRDDIRNYINGNNGRRKKKFDNIRVYENARILHPVRCERGLNHLIKFDISKLRKIYWKNGKHLIYGSLLILSSDGFATCFSAKVTDSDYKDRSRGLVTVKFVEENTIAFGNFSGEFQFVESKVYFESVCHVLECLQRIHDIPLKRYLLKCKKEILPPKYLRKKSELTIENNASKEITLPDLSHLCLNETQSKAVTSALTRELCVIQGPPGCGKTYVGLKIVELLMCKNWQRQNIRLSPILLLCYTNDALDQFMEGVLKFSKGIIRIGGRSRSDVLKPYNLKRIRQKKRRENQSRANHMHVRSRSKTILEKSMNTCGLPEDKSIMQGASIIGMTTTCGARYQAVLNEIKPKIIIVEEAGEIVESHIIANLTTGCEQLIMIGDHKQLKPKINAYKLKKDFKLDISLFERLVMNGVAFECLDTQYRMRPEIAEPLRFIYDGLKNHKSVLNYDDIKGVGKNMFMINHNYQESRMDFETSSSKNVHEAKYVAALYKYLRQQGYSHADITVLTTYKEQLDYLKKLFFYSNEDLLSNASLETVDGYQGMENRIIILSLVRSNTKGRIGFLEKENRVCVALSRAQEGLFVIGNFDNLSKSSNLWKKITDHLKEKDCFGNALPLYCQNHPRSITNAGKAVDFKHRCMEVCNIRLPCGHSCDKLCHVDDKDHTEAICIEQCEKKCKNNHTCKLRCSDPCFCTENIKVTFRYCRHEMSFPCGTEEEDQICTHECGIYLKCGHRCSKRCDEICNPCVVMVDLVSEICGHSKRVECNQCDSKDCPVACALKLKCGHACKERCDKDIHNSESNFNSCTKGHQSDCKEMCGKTLPCGHICSGKCNQCLLMNSDVTCVIHKKCTDCNPKCEHKCSRKSGPVRARGVPKSENQELFSQNNFALKRKRPGRDYKVTEKKKKVNEGDTLRSDKYFNFREENTFRQRKNNEERSERVEKTCNQKKHENLDPFDLRHRLQKKRRYTNSCDKAEQSGNNLEMSSTNDLWGKTIDKRIVKAEREYGDCNETKTATVKYETDEEDDVWLVLDELFD